MSPSLILVFFFFFTLFFIPFFHFAAGDDQIYDSATNGNHRTDIKPSNKPLPSKKSHKVKKKKKHCTQCALSDIKDSSNARIPASPLQLSGCGVLQITFLAFKVTATTFTLRYLFTPLCSVSPHLAGLSGDMRQLRRSKVRPRFKGADERLCRLVFIYAISN